MVARDADHFDPEQQYATVAECIQQYPSALYGNNPFFLSLARDDKVNGLRRCLFNQTAGSSPVAYDQLYVASLGSQSIDCQKAVLEQLALSVANYNDVRHGKATVHHQLGRQSTVSDGGAMVRQLVNTSDDDVLLYVLELLPMLSTRDSKLSNATDKQYCSSTSPLPPKYEPTGTAPAEWLTTP